MNLYKYASLYNANLAFKQSTATGRSRNLREPTPDLQGLSLSFQVQIFTTVPFEPLSDQ